MQWHIDHPLQLPHGLHHHRRLVDFRQAHVDVQNCRPCIDLIDGFFQNIAEIFLANGFFQALFPGGIQPFTNDRHLIETYRLRTRSHRCHASRSGRHRSASKLVSQRLAEIGNKRRCRPATTAHNPHALAQHLCYITCIFRYANRINRLACYHLRQPGIGLYHHRHFGHRQNLRD